MKNYFERTLSVIAISGTLLGSVLVNAADTASDSTTVPAATSTTTAPVPGSRLRDRFTSSYVGVYTGGSTSDLGGSNNPTVDGKPDPNGPQQLENYLGVFYKLSETTKIGPQAHFFYSPVESRNLTLKDPLLQISNSSIYSSGNFKVSGYLRAYLPASRESRDIGRLLQLRLLLNPAYEVPNSRLTVGVYTYAQPAFYNSTGQGTTFTGYVGPNLTYQISRTVAITALYEMAMTHTKNTGGNLDFNNGGTDFEPGVNWDVTPNLSLNPYLNIYTGNRIAMENTSINMLILGKLF